MEVATNDVAPMAMALGDAAASATSPTPPMPSGEAENIAVCIRVRPLNDREVRNKDASALRSVSAMNLISIVDSDGQPLPGKHNVFQYDHIFDDRCSTRAMYNSVAQRIVKSSLDGINGTIFAYGQTSSGKTYTMTGTGGEPFQPENSPSSLPASSSMGDQSMGILQLAVEDIFSYIEQSTDRDFLLRVSFVEIYNEVVKDLLTESKLGHNLKLREDPRKGVYVESKEEIITNYEDILRLLYVGNQRRTVGHTAMNDKSSRSHSIFKIVIESKEKSASRRQSEDDMNGAVLVASLSLVDLAGSESMRHTAAEGMRQREAGNINKSLLTLSRVINILANGASQGGQPVMAPFRDSKLTRLLQNSLDGNTRTLIICCVTPSDRYLDETKSTLQFAARAKNIQTSAHVNEILDDQAQLKRLKREVHELKKLVNRNGDTEALNALKAENEALHNAQNKNKAEIGRLLGLILCSSSESVRGIASARKLEKPRAKRMRETWHPGDFTANKVRATALDSKIAAFASPNPQPRKRQIPDESKENVDPKQNLLAALNDADSSDDDDGDVELDAIDDDTDEIMGFGSVESRRRHPARSGGNAAAETQVRQLVELLESALLRTKEADGDGNESMPHTNLESRIMRLVSESQELAAAAKQNEQLVGQQELLKMAIEELQTRVQLAQDREQEELSQLKQAFETVQEQLETERAKTEELSDEKESWLTERAQMEASLAEALAKLEALSLQATATTEAASKKMDLENAVSELSARNQSLQQELDSVCHAAEEMTRTHEKKVSELEDVSKREVDEISSQLQDAYVELEELKLEKEDEINKLEEELLTKSDALEQKLAEFSAREAELIQEITSLQAMQSTARDAHADALKKQCEELSVENERLTSERSNLMDAMIELEDQLAQTTTHQAQLDNVKVEMETTLAALQSERDALVEQLHTSQSNVSDGTPQQQQTTEVTARIQTLEEELARAHEELDEASNDQEAEANRADEAVRELERTKLGMEETLQRHKQELERMAAVAGQREQELQTTLTETTLKLQQVTAAEDEARAYKDFLQLEMDDLSTKTANLEAAKIHFASENTQLRQQIDELNEELMEVPNGLATQIGQLMKCIDTLQADVDAKNAAEKCMVAEIAKMVGREDELSAKLVETSKEVARLRETVQALDEDKAVWLQKSASSEELQAEMVRMREERWGLASKWEESEQALAKERRELQRVTTELEELRASHDSLETDKHVVSETLAEKETELRQVASELDATQTEKMALEDLVTEVEAKFEILEIAKKSLDDSLAVRVAEVASKANENAALRTLLSDAEDELKELRGQLSDRKTSTTASTAVVDELHARVQSLESKCIDMEQEKTALSQEIEDMAHGKTALVEELSALEAQLMILSEEKIDLQTKVEDAVDEAEASRTKMEGANDAITSLERKLEVSREELTRIQATKDELQTSLDATKATLVEKESSVAPVTPAALEELTLRLESESQRREKAELDATSYSETLEILREQLKTKSDALKSLELAVPETTLAKERLEAEVAKLREELARAQEEQAELRYQNQQRLLSTEVKESALAAKVETLEQQLTDAKDSLVKTETEWKARAQQAEQHFRRLETELQETKQSAEASKQNAQHRVDQLTQQLEETKTALVETETEWKKRAQQAEDHFRRLEEELRAANDERTRLAELAERSGVSSEEMDQLKRVHESLIDEKQRLAEQLDAREKFWEQRVEELQSKAAFESKGLREQWQDTQEEMEAYQTWAHSEIGKLRATIEQNDAEMIEMNRAADETKAREESLVQQIEQREAQLHDLQTTVQSMEAKLSEREGESDAAVRELSSKVRLLTQELEDVALERDNHVEEYATLKAAMEKLEGEDYQHRNELEELAESLKSSQMEAMHYHTQLTEVQAKKSEMDTLVDTQKKRIDKLEKVKMTTETLELFRKLKTDRQDLQVQVQKLQAQLKELASSKALSKEAAEQQHARLLRLKEEEVGMLKSHVEELKLHMEELKRAVQNEKATKSELQSEVDDMRDKTQQELEDMRAVLKEKSDQVVELEVQIQSLRKHQHAMADRTSSKESFLEKENLELLVENRQLKKRLETRGGCNAAMLVASSAATAAYRMEEDVAAFEASAKAASALLAEPSVAHQYDATSVTTHKSAPAPVTETETAMTMAVKTPTSGGGLSSFLLSSSSSSSSASTSKNQAAGDQGKEEDEEEARPACSQQ